jgi:predicted dehydrogenase
MISIGIIGYGYWGPNLVRNFFIQNNCKIKAVVDARPERLTILTNAYPSIIALQSAEDLINDPTIDAVVIATPVFSHFDLARKALQNGKHVMLEKPMTASVEESNELIALATEKKLTLMVDHTFLYTGAVKKMKALIDNNELGKINYFDSSRLNLGLIQQDVNVLWDLAPHDISILNYLVGYNPIAVQAIGVSHIHNKIENIAYLTIKYEENFIAHFHCSWSSPVKVRTIMIGGDNKMIVFNDNEPTEKLKIYDTGHNVTTDDEKTKLLIDYRTGDIFVPKIENIEALNGVAKDFLNAIETGESPKSDWKSGLNVIKVLEAADQSIKNKGIEVKL